MQICKYSNIRMCSSDHPPPVSTGCGLQIIYKYLNICIYANMQIFEYSYVIFWPPSPLSTDLDIWIYANMQIFKYSYVIFWPPSPVTADSECNRIKDYLEICKYLNICILSKICEPVWPNSYAQITPKKLISITTPRLAKREKVNVDLIFQGCPHWKPFHQLP